MTSTTLGFLCQHFSAMGLREGVSDRHGRGRIITHIVAALQAKQTRAFILENVQGPCHVAPADLLPHIADTALHWRQCL